MKEEINHIKQIILMATIAVLVIALIVAIVNISKQKQTNNELQKEIKEIKQSIKMPEDTIQSENPENAIETQQQ